MTQFLIKTILTAFLIAAVSELAKRWTFAAALLVSLPLTSILALTWLYLEERNLKAVSVLSMSIFWMVIPSLVFFPLFAGLLRYMNFGAALASACAGTAITYWAYVWIVAFFGIKLT